MLCIPTSRKPVTLDTPVLNTIQKSTPARDRMKMLSSLLAECEIIFASSRPSASQAYHCWTILNGVTEVDECNSKNTEYYTLSSLNFLLPTLYPSSLNLLNTYVALSDSNLQRFRNHTKFRIHKPLMYQHIVLITLSYFVQIICIPLRI
jgi:hypothetical protein